MRVNGGRGLLAVLAGASAVTVATCLSSEASTAFDSYTLWDMLGANLQMKLMALFGSTLIALVGVLPLLVIPVNTRFDEDGLASRNLRMLLGFACGGLLADVFLHLLPEAAQRAREAQEEGKLHGLNSDTFVNCWVITGIMVFMLLEKVVVATEGPCPVPDTDPCAPGEKESEKHDHDHDHGHGHSHDHDLAEPLTPGKGEKGQGLKIGQVSSTNATAVTAAASKTPCCSGCADGSGCGGECVNAAGVLNLMVNTLDNFTHGLAVAAAFCMSIKVGMLTTLAIVLHEIPHEIGDYAILIKSGFSRPRAIFWQLCTSSGGIVGTIVGLTIEGVGQATTWILPFTAGGFIYIALVSLAPDLLTPLRGWPWWRDIVHVLVGGAVVGAAAMVE
eukprot:m.105358 g.105358  ORF g.105358 m.105358 type:complete len:389 (+) comp15794_c0_seq4:349-1515(+)